MVQPIASVSAVPTVTPASPASPAQERAPDIAAADPARAASSLSVSVEKAQDGAFVYTLRETPGGRLLVVIPHLELHSGGTADARA